MNQFGDFESLIQDKARLQQIEFCRTWLSRNVNSGDFYMAVIRTRQIIAKGPSQRGRDLCRHGIFELIPTLTSGGTAVGMA